MIHFFKLIRLQNLLMIALVQVLIKYALFEPFAIDTSLSTIEFIFLVIATMCIAAGGNIINDIQDVAIDKINKPGKVLIGKKITEQTAYNYYLILNVIGVGLGFYLANSIGKPGFAALFIVFSALLYLYATYLKSIVLVGNIVISILVAMSIIIVGLFELFPAITETNRVAQSTLFSILLDYALFAFLMTLLRELVKDVEDIDGDKNGGLQTLPILLGRKRTVKIILGLAILVIILIVYYLYTYMYQQQTAMLYFLVFVVGPLLYFCIQLLSATKKEDFSYLSGVLKFIMLLGILSMLLYPFILT